MNNGPVLVIRGAILGCVLVCVLVSLINGSNSPAALAAVGSTAADSPISESPAMELFAAEQPAAEQPAIETTDQTKGDGKKAKGDQPKNTECKLSGNYPSSILQWCSLITKAAREYDLPANLIAALVLQESGGQASAYSASGAVGLMQVMPRDGIAASFQCVNGPCFASRPSIAELQDPAFNIDYGTRFLAGLVARRGSLREALFAYGPSGMGYAYADKVLGIYEAYGSE